jgi:hypothetical protein
MKLKRMENLLFYSNCEWALILLRDVEYLGS